MCQGSAVAPEGAPAREVTRLTAQREPSGLELALSLPALPLNIELLRVTKPRRPYLEEYWSYRPQATKAQALRLARLAALISVALSAIPTAADEDVTRRTIRTAAWAIEESRRILRLVRFRSSRSYRRRIILQEMRRPTTLAGYLAQAHRRGATPKSPSRSRKHVRVSAARVVGAAAGRRSDTSSPSPPADAVSDEPPPAAPVRPPSKTYAPDPRALEFALPSEQPPRQFHALRNLYELTRGLPPDRAEEWIQGLNLRSRSILAAEAGQWLIERRASRADDGHQAMGGRR